MFWQVPGDAACGCGDPRGSVDEFAADGRGDGFVQLRDPTVYTLHLTPAIVLIAAFTSEFSRAVIEAPYTVMSRCANDSKAPGMSL